MLNRNIWAVGLCSLLLVACNKQEPTTTSAVTAKTTAPVSKISKECQEYMQVLRELGKEDAKLQEALDKNLDKLDAEWATLSAEEQEQHTKQCVLMIAQYAKLQEVEIKQSQ